jgi:hypothetical protein
MNGLDSAKTWFEGELARLRHVQDLSENHDQQPLLRELLGDLLRLKKGERKLRFKAEREDLHRLALMRLFAGFESDFRQGFLSYLRTRSGLSEQELEETLPDAISIWLTIYRVLETRTFPKSLLGQLNRIRDERNRLAHGGFHQNIAHTSPEDAYEVLRRALQLLAQSQNNYAL